MRCTLKKLAKGGSVDILVSTHVVLTAGHDITNIATVSGDQPDPDPADNSDAIQTSVI